MPVRVEFYGIPRQRAGVKAADARGENLAQVLVDLAGRFPEFGTACVREGRLAAGYTANVNGDCFVSDGNLELSDGDTLLILSADAGG